MPFLFFYRSAQELLHLDLTELVSPDQPLVFGSKVGNYVVPDPSIAPMAFDVALEGERYRLTDRSGAGTWLNGDTVRSALLNDGDSFRLGTIQLLYNKDLPEGFGDREGPQTQVDPLAPAPLPRDLWLVARRRDGGAQARIDLGARALAGSGEGCDLHLQSGTVSARHLEFTRERGAIRVRDLGSTNGTWLGPVRVESVLLPLGTRVRVGDWEVWVTAQEERGPRAVAIAGGLVTADPAMLALIAQADAVAATNASIFIAGESGSGKEALARFIHERSKRAAGKLVTLNCGLGRSAEGFAAQLSGWRKGSFTGADRDEPGTLATADGGTVFLDEVDATPLAHQPALLRAVENGEIHPLGAPEPRRVDVRFIAATHRHMGRAIRQGEFREDLYNRIAVVKLVVPPLRARKGDIPALWDYFTRKLSGSYALRLSDAALAKMMDYDWPGNVRELWGVAYRAMIFTMEDPCDESKIIFDENLSDEEEAAAPTAAPAQGTPVYPSGKRWDQIVPEILKVVMLDNKGVRRAACRQLGFDMKRLLRMLDEHGLQGVGREGEE